jgi:hypothetical protein
MAPDPAAVTTPQDAPDLDELQDEWRRWRRARRFTYLPEALLSAVSVLSLDRFGDELLDVLRADDDSRAPQQPNGPTIRADLIVAMTTGDGERPLIDVLTARRFRARRPWITVQGSLAPTRDGLLWCPTDRWVRWGAREQALQGKAVTSVVLLTAGEEVRAMVFGLTAGQLSLHTRISSADTSWVSAFVDPRIVAVGG